MVVMDQYTRRIIGFAVHAGNVDGPALCRMFNNATSGQGWPKYISSDNDPLFQYHRWKANLRVLDIEEIKSVDMLGPVCPVSGARRLNRAKLLTGSLLTFRVAGGLYSG